MSAAQITSRVYVSGLDAALNHVLIANRNITLIINASDLQASYPHPGHVEILHVPIEDRPHQPLAPYLDTVADKIHSNRSGSTLVHCTQGRSRSPALVMAYLMKYENMRLCQAWDVMMDKRPSVRPNAGFWRQLIDYEVKLFGSNTVRMVKTPSGVLPEVQHHDPDADAYCLNT